VVAVTGLVVGFPLMLLIAVLVKVSSPGPAIFRQVRVGLDRRWLRSRRPDSRRQEDTGGKPFTIYKFRTMTSGGHLPDAEVWASPHDPRVTRIGRVLRQYRLDELPQLWNVITGDMNIVGPRPEQPRILLNLRQQITEYPARQRVRPGITGWAQINHHYDRSIDDVRRKVAFDLEYIERQSVAEDLWIMARTVPVILTRYGAW
jgi:lipopolysaccharide/colanic/teichoic acid biosynthesis glycosyltransferase